MKKIYLFLIPLFTLALLAGCNNGQDNNAAPGASSDTAAMDCQPNTDWGKVTDTVILKTSMGDITVDLYGNSAPKTVENFIGLASAGYYNGLTFHRVIPDFMIQGGDPDGNGTGGESVFGDKFEDEINADSYCLQTRPIEEMIDPASLPDELIGKTIKQYYELQGYKYNSDLSSLPMERGVMAMANRGPNTNASQFFIVQKENGTPWLEGKHTVFGKVREGLDIVDAIAVVQRDAMDQPVEPITYTVEVVE